MSNYQNQLDRFRTIAKKLVDDHCAELFTSSKHVEAKKDTYSLHLDTLGKQLDEQAQQFISSSQAGNESLRSEIWNVCKKYLEQFVRRSEPDGERRAAY